MTYINNITSRYIIGSGILPNTNLPPINTDESKPKVKPSPESKLTPAFIHKLLNGELNDTSVNINGVRHYQYADCAPLDITTSKNGIKLHKKTALAFQEMHDAAAKDGIDLTLVSGFRAKEYQKNVFRKKGATADIIRNRVKASAPPGFSEHHTGLAIDMNSVDPKDFKEGGKYYKVYKWLVAHAKEYGFEQSFPANNAQGVMEEAWHWRFVGKKGEFKDVFKEARMNDPRYIQEYK